MLKKVCIASAVLSLALSTGISANWITGNETTLAVSQGEAAFQMALSTDQRLAMNLATSDTATADVVFSTKDSNSILTLSASPVQVSDDEHHDATVKVTQLVNDGNGLRFYLVNTGDVNGAYIVSYRKGIFKAAFAAQQLDETGTSSFEVTKKEILLHVTNENGTSTYLLTYDTKENVFTAKKQ